MRRTTSVLAAVATTCAAVVGLALPAQAQYATQPLALGWAPSGTVFASVSGDGVVYVGGRLDGTGGIAAVDASTGDLRWKVATDADVRALTLSPDGSRLYAGGSFRTVAGQSHEHVVAIDVADHAVDPTFQGRVGGQVRDLVARGDRLYLAGRFTSVDGVLQRGLGAMNAVTGARDARFSLNADGDVFGLALTGNRLLVSGAFHHLGGWPRQSLAAVDLGTDRLIPWAPLRLCPYCGQYWDVQTDGKNVYVATSGNAAGAYRLSSGLPAWKLLRTDGDVQALWLPGDGRVYLGGHFNRKVWVGGRHQTAVAATLVVSVDTATGRVEPDWTPKLFTSYPGVWTFTSTPGALWVGGAFTGAQVEGQNDHAPYLAAYPTP